MPLVNADLAKPECTKQSAAGVVLDEDARDQLPEARIARGGEERFHRHASGAASARGAGGVDGELGDAGVAIARTVGGRRGERDYVAAVVLNDDDRMASVEPP